MPSKTHTRLAAGGTPAPDGANLCDVVRRVGSKSLSGAFVLSLCLRRLTRNLACIASR